MEGEDIRKVMKWIAFVYVPVLLIFVGVYLLVQYRLHKIDLLRKDSTPPPGVHLLDARSADRVVVESQEVR